MLGSVLLRIWHIYIPGIYYYMYVRYCDFSCFILVIGLAFLKKIALLLQQ